jgi:hypothetical protein
MDLNKQFVGVAQSAFLENRKNNINSSDANPLTSATLIKNVTIKKSKQTISPTGSPNERSAVVSHMSDLVSPETLSKLGDGANMPGVRLTNKVALNMVRNR